MKIQAHLLNITLLGQYSDSRIEEVKTEILDFSTSQPDLDIQYVNSNYDEEFEETAVTFVLKHPLENIEEWRSQFENSTTMVDFSTQEITRLF